MGEGQYLQTMCVKQQNIINCRTQQSSYRVSTMILSIYNIIQPSIAAVHDLNVQQIVKIRLHYISIIMIFMPKDASA